MENDDVTIEYKAKTGGSVTPDHETLAPVKDTAVGSVATPDAGYHFVRWTDAKGNEVGTNPKFVPEKVNGVNAAATYYAVFEENAAITIHYNATAGGSVTPGKYSRNGTEIYPSQGEWCKCGGNLHGAFRRK